MNLYKVEVRYRDTGREVVYLVGAECELKLIELMGVRETDSVIAQELGSQDDSFIKQIVGKIDKGILCVVSDSFIQDLDVNVDKVFKTKMSVADFIRSKDSREIFDLYEDLSSYLSGEGLPSSLMKLRYIINSLASMGAIEYIDVDGRDIVPQEVVNRAIIERMAMEGYLEMHNRFIGNAE